MGHTMLLLLAFYQKQLNFLIILFYLLFLKELKAVLAFFFRTKKERAEVTCNRRVLCEHTLFILKRWRDKIKICFLTTGKFFKRKDEKEKHFTMQTFSLCTLNKPRTQLNTDLSGVFQLCLIFH